MRFIRKVGTYVWHAAICIAVLTLAIVVFWAVSYIVSVHHRRKAERLLQQLAELQPGTTDVHMVQRIARESGGRAHCTGDLCSYDFENSFAFTNSGPLRVFRRTEWDYFGLRPWQVTAQIRMNGDKLTGTEFGAFVGRGQGWLYHEGPFSGSMWAWLAVSVMVDSGRFEQSLGFEKETVRKEAIRTGRQIEAGSGGIIVVKPNLDTPGGGEALEVYLSPSAPPGSRKDAFDLNLRCASTMQPCTELCQLATSAWHSYTQFMKSNGWAVAEPMDCAAANHQ